MTKYRKPIRKYLRQIWVLLPCSFKEKRAIISMLDKTLKEYVITNPTASYEAIKSHFGEPEEIVCSYFHHLDSASLTQKWRTRKSVSLILLVIATTLAVFLCVTPIKDNKPDSTEPESEPTYSEQITDIDKLEQQLNAYQDALAQINSSK